MFTSKRRKIVLITLLVVALAALGAARSDRLGMLISEPDGTPNDSYVYKTILPNGSTSITANVLTFTPTAASLSGTVAINQGGTGQVTAAAAFGALKQDATDAATGVVELATDAETLTGTATDRALTPANLTAKMAAPGDIGGTTPYEGRFVGLSGSKVRVVKTGDAALTANECRGTYVCNQGASGEIDLTLYALEETSSVVFSNEEAFVIEVGPPSGERFLFDGTWLDADDCIDMSTTESSDMVCVRKKAQSGTTWYYKCDSITGTHTDTGASD